MLSPSQNNLKEGDRYFSGKTKSGSTIYIGTITRDQLQDAGVTGQSTGYYICELDDEDPIAGLNVLASFVNIEAAYHFANELGLFELDSSILAFEDPLDDFHNE
jgi:hypothetical protein